MVVEFAVKVVEYGVPVTAVGRANVVVTLKFLDVLLLPLFIGVVKVNVPLAAVALESVPAVAVTAWL